MTEDEKSEEMTEFRAKPRLLNTLTESVRFTPFCCNWVPRSAQLTVCGESARRSGVVKVLTIADGLHALCTVACDSGIKCSAVTTEKPRLLFTGHFDGGVCIWDLLKEAPAKQWPAAGGVVNGIDVCADNGALELAVASSGGLVRVYDPRAEEPVTELRAADGSTAADAWSVAFCNSFCGSQRALVGGFDNGDLKLIDLRTQTEAWKKRTANGKGAVAVQCDSRRLPLRRLVAATLDSCFYTFDLEAVLRGAVAHSSEKTEKPPRVLQSTVPNGGTLWAARHSPQNRDAFVVCSGNGTVALWKHCEQMNAQIGSWQLSTQPINSWHWHPQKRGLAVATALDQTIRVLCVTQLNRI